MCDNLRGKEGLGYHNIETKVKDNETYKRGYYIINDTKATNNVKGKVFEHYSRPVNADRTDSISLVKDEVQTLA
ncbi:11918_t:CDS:2, partial [Racocetra persica]